MCLGEGDTLHLDVNGKFGKPTIRALKVRQVVLCGAFAVAAQDAL